MVNIATVLQREIAGLQREIGTLEERKFELSQQISVKRKQLTTLHYQVRNAKQRGVPKKR